jgi:hypothetical protein
MRERPREQYCRTPEGTRCQESGAAHNPKVAGSNPAPATNENRRRPVLTHRPSACSAVCIASGAENGAVRLVCDFADRVADGVPHNPMVIASTTQRDSSCRLLPSRVVLYLVDDACNTAFDVVKVSVGQRTRRRRAAFDHLTQCRSTRGCQRTRPRPCGWRSVCRPSFARHASSTDDWRVKELPMPSRDPVRGFSRPVR